jgi:hypothetical protein
VAHYDVEKGLNKSFKKLNKKQYVHIINNSSVI